MAIGCINRNSAEYQYLKEVSGIPESQIDAACIKYLEKYNRFPRLDELYSSNSSKYIQQKLKLDKNNSTSIEKVLEFTGSDSLEDAVITLNRQFSDVETSIIPVDDKVIVKSVQRPTTTYKEVEKHSVDNINDQSVIIKALNKLSDLYGIKVNQITEQDLQDPKWDGIIQSDRFTKAFIYNGEIFINIDRYSPDSFIHEMLHLLVGSMRFTNPELYQELISYVENIPNYEYELQKYEGKTRNDANEEIFVTELAKYLTGMDSKLSTLTDNQLYEISYNVHRILDSMLMGDYSSKIFDNNIYSSTLLQVIKATNSDIMEARYKIFQEGSATHRRLNNMKQDLLKKGELTEICD